MTREWLFLLHHISQHPNYLRVRVGRLIQAAGAVALKNSIYALPDTPGNRTVFKEVASEVVAGGGDAVVVGGRMLAGLTDAGLIDRFRSVREAAYRAIAAKAGELAPGTREAGKPSRRSIRQLSLLKRRLEREAALDFFGAPGRVEIAKLLDGLAAGAAVPAEGPEGGPGPSPGRMRGRTWVTRRGILADRIASAWLIRRFIDPDARFRFVAGGDAQTAAGELRFDMRGGEFTHEGDRCTFEILVARFALDDPALAQIGEIIHDIDLKDDKFGRSEAPGLERLVLGLAAAHQQDTDRLAVGTPLFEALYHSYRRAST